MIRKRNRGELSAVTINYILVILCMAFVIVISQYHISFEGYRNLTQEQWHGIWAISENTLALIMCVIIVLNTTEIIKHLFGWFFIPYFIVKLIYQFSCLLGIYIFDPSIWQTIWVKFTDIVSLGLIGLIIICFSYLMLKNHRNAT